MARTYKASGVTRTVTATTAQTLVFNPGEIESSGVVAYHLSFTGAGNAYGDITRVRLKANGVTIIDVDSEHLAAYFQSQAWSNHDFAAADTTFTLPLYDLAAPSDDLADMQQFPRGAQATLEVVTGAAVVAGTLAIGWTKTTVDPVLFPRLIGTPLNIAASQTNARYTFATDGVVAGFGINTTGLDNVRMICSGEELVDVTGALYQTIRQAFNVDADVNPLFLKLNAGLPADAGSSYFLLNTAAGWAGVGNEVSIYEQVPQFEG